jgi:hypothetical protein
VAIMRTIIRRIGVRPVKVNGTGHIGFIQFRKG